MSAVYDELTLENDPENEEFLGGLLRGVGGMLGLGEGEEEAGDGEAFGDHEDFASEPFAAVEGFSADPFGELEEEQFLGGLLKGVGGMLGLSEAEEEAGLDGFGDPELFGEGFGDYEDEGEPFLPALLPIAKLALPAIAQIIGSRGRGRSREGEAGAVAAVPGAPAVPAPSVAEYLAAAAATTDSESEADAMIGAATVMSLTARERAALQSIVPDLVRAATVLSRILRRRPETRPVVRVVPTIIKASAKPLTARVASGRVVTRPVAAKVVTTQARKVLTQPRTTRAALQRNARVVRRVTSPARPMVG